MNEKNLRPLWDAIIEVYREVAGICEREGIQYFVAYGSALGAVRHHGFIPWDDDMDLVMPIQDYQRFLQIADTKLPKHLALVTNANMPGFDYNYAKVSDLRVEKVLSVSMQSGHPMAGGINIDIFPISAAPASSLLNRMRAIILKMRRSYVLGGEFRTLKSKIGWFGGFLLGAVMMGKYSSQREFETLCWKDQVNVQNKGTNMVGWYSKTDCRHVECVPASCYSSVAMMKFEGFDVPIPGDYDLYLKSLYGDYMTPVKPKENLFSHGRVEPQAWRFGPTNRGAI